MNKSSKKSKSPARPAAKRKITIKDLKAKNTAPVKGGPGMKPRYDKHY